MNVRAELALAVDVLQVLLRSRNDPRKRELIRLQLRYVRALKFERMGWHYAQR